MTPREDRFFRRRTFFLRRRVLRTLPGGGSSGGSIWNRSLQSPPRVVLLSFAAVVLTGTVLLMIPAATTGEGSLPVLDALFTATSATCVTGLVVADTGSAFTLFGQGVILLLIQVGGLGIMTLSTFFIYLLSGHLSFLEREVIVDTLSQSPVEELTRLLKTVFLFTVTLELLGSVLLALRFWADVPLPQALYLGLFHGVSAFCNAGFSLFPGSFVAYRGDVWVNLILCGLIVAGGLGFVVLLDLRRRGRPFAPGAFSKLSLHTRIVLAVTALLVLGGALLFFGLEYTNSLEGMSLAEKGLTSLFQSVTTRTAGFNSVDVSSLTNATLFIFVLLMFVGASPGSCGGGIKTTTAAVLLASIVGRLRLREDVNLLERRIPEATVSRVISILFFSLTIVILFTALLLVTELPRVPHTETRGLFFAILFEVVSAFGTVGLSTGLTETLSPAGKVLVTLLMFVGRLGPLTVALALRGRESPVRFKYMKENVMIG